MHRFPVSALLLATSSLAWANTGNEGFGIYDTNPVLTTGQASGFLTLFVSPDNMGDLNPATADARGGTGTLIIENTSTASAEVRVGDTLVGVLGPITNGHLEGVSAGAYQVTLTLPNGFASQSEVHATSVTGQAPVIEAPVNPLETPEAPEEDSLLDK
jgi:hypothetical protein